MTTSLNPNLVGDHQPEPQDVSIPADGWLACSPSPLHLLRAKTARLHLPFHYTTRS